MRIGIMSDSHGSIKQVEQVVLNAGEVDMWLHCGDIVEDSNYLKEIVDVPVIAVAGNNDFRNEAPDEEIFSVEGFKILVTHGHYYGVRYDTDGLVEAAEEKGCNIAIYGHTHVAYKKKHGNILVLNPGSAALPRDGMSPSYMIMDLEAGKEPEISLFRMERAKMWGLFG